MSRIWWLLVHLRFPVSRGRDLILPVWASLLPITAALLPIRVINSINSHCGWLSLLVLGAVAQTLFCLVTACTNWYFMSRCWRCWCREGSAKETLSNRSLASFASNRCRPYFKWVNLGPLILHFSIFFADQYWSLSTIVLLQVMNLFACF